MTDRLIKAETILYRWACEKLSTGCAKAALARLGFDVDFRQADLGNVMYGFDIDTGDEVQFVI